MAKIYEYKGKKYCEIDISDEWQGIVLARMVEDMPTIDPVGHGKWVGGDGKPKRDRFSVYCSSCGKWSEYRTKYCGECGAKMDGE